MAAKKLNPAELVIARFGGGRKLGRIIECESAPGHWKRRGRVPQDRFRELLDKAQQHKKKLSIDELVDGGYL